MPTTPAWPTMPTVPCAHVPRHCTQCVWKRKRQCTAAGSMHDGKNFSTTSFDKRAYMPCVRCASDFQNGGSHLGQRFSAIPHPIVPRFSPLEPQFIPTIQVFLRIWKFVPVCIWERKVCDDVANFGQILAYFWGSCPPGGRQPKNMGCVIN